MTVCDGVDARNWRPFVCSRGLLFRPAFLIQSHAAAFIVYSSSNGNTSCSFARWRRGRWMINDYCGDYRLSGGCDVVALFFRECCQVFFTSSPRALTTALRQTRFLRKLFWREIGQLRCSRLSALAISGSVITDRLVCKDCHFTKVLLSIFIILRKQSAIKVTSSNGRPWLVRQAYQNRFVPNIVTHSFVARYKLEGSKEGWNSTITVNCSL